MQITVCDIPARHPNYRVPVATRRTFPGLAAAADWAERNGARLFFIRGNNAEELWAFQNHGNRTPEQLVP